MVFQFHKGQHTEKCVMCGSLRKLHGFLSNARITPDIDVGGWWEIFPGLAKCSGHHWRRVPSQAA